MRRNFVALAQPRSSPRGLGAASAAPASTAAERLPGELQLPEQRRAGGHPGWTPTRRAPTTGSCQPDDAGTRDPVVLVHGTFGNKNTNWQTYAPLLANNGYCVFALTYGVAAGTPRGLDQFGGTGPDRDQRQQLKAFVTKVLPAPPVPARSTSSGHSQGTLMPNYYAKFLGGGAVHPQLRLARPALARHQPRRRTASSAESMSGLRRRPRTPGRPAAPPAARWSTGSAFMQKMRAGEWRCKGISYTNIVTKYDQLVAALHQRHRARHAQHHRPGRLRHGLHRALRDRRRPGGCRRTS